jgi:hypothetical protein
MEFRERITTGGLILPNDNGQATGIRPRWGRVYAVGPEQTSVSVGEYVCIAHGRWTRGLEIEDGQGTRTIRRIDPSDILLVSDELPQDDTMSEALDGRYMKTTVNDFAKDGL